MATMAMQEGQHATMLKELWPIILKAIDLGDFEVATNAYNQIATAMGAPAITFIGKGKKDEIYLLAGDDGQMYVTTRDHIKAYLNGQYGKDWKKAFAPFGEPQSTEPSAPLLIEGKQDGTKTNGPYIN